MLGTCDIGWSYMLAVIGCCDAFLLGLLALSLGYRQVILEDKEEDSLASGYLVNNIGQETLKPVFVSSERLTAGVSRDSLFTQNNLLL